MHSMVTNNQIIVRTARVLFLLLLLLHAFIFLFELRLSLYAKDQTACRLNSVNLKSYQREKRSA